MSDDYSGLLGQLDAAQGHGGEMGPHVINGLLSDARDAIEQLRADKARLIEAMDWVLIDASYKAPESIDFSVAERWLSRLGAAMQEAPDDA